MNTLEEFDRVVGARLAVLAEAGAVRYAYTPLGKREGIERATLGLHTAGADFELIVWMSGVVEFVYGTETDPHFESGRLESDADLDDSVVRLARLAREWTVGAR